MGSIGEPSQDQFSDYEKVYLHMSRAFKPLKKEHWAVHCVCSINYKPQIPNDTTIEIGKKLRDSWKKLAVEYPGLTVRPVGFTKHYAELDEAVLEDWASETFFVEDDISADEIIADREPKELVTLYYQPRDSEVILLSQHWRTDALGCCMLLDRFFDLVASGSDQSPTTKRTPSLSPCLEVAAGASPEEDAEIQACAREHIDAFHAKAVNAGGLPFEGDAVRPPARTKHHDLIFSASDTQRIVQACKDHRISVSAAIHVALARTYFSFGKKNDSEKKKAGYTTVMAVNMRPYLQNPYNEPAHACQTYVVSITPTVPYPSVFVDAARTLTSEYRSWYTDKFRRSLCWLFKYHIEKLFPPPPPHTSPNPTRERIADAAPPPPKPPSGVTLSSLGIVEQRLKGRYGDNCVTVDRFRFGVSVMTRQTLLYAWTFRGQLTLSLDYNEAYYSQQMVEEVLLRLKTHLVGGLDVASLGA